MGECRVSADGVTYQLPRPFFVLATENPVEQAGTFPLPEAQLDRFMLKLEVGYPHRVAEAEVLRTNKRKEVIDALTACSDLDAVVAMMDWVTGVTVSEPLQQYIVDV